MSVWLLVAIAGSVLLALYVSARRAITIVELEVSRGTVRVVRGGIAPPVLGDLRDVAASPRMDGVHIRVVRSGGRAEVQLSGSVDDAQAQRIRNVIGSVPLARLVNARRR